MRLVDRIGRVSRAEVKVLIQAWILLGLVDLGLRWLPFGVLRKWLDWRFFAPPSPGADFDGRSIERLRRWVDAAANRHWTEMTCLRRALVLRRLLAGRGVASELRIGVRRDGESVTAHAWLDCGGRMVGASPESFPVLEPPGNSVESTTSRARP